MGDILGAGPDIPYKARLERLVQSGIALWDVCGAASREGSLDSNIRSPEPNDFALFFGIHRNIEAICFNGQPAEKMFRRYVVPSMEQRLPLIPLPSTSPAYAGMNVEQKLARWREALLPFLLP
jgi:TDG/mug DNA glycosylase family protein